MPKVQIIASNTYFIKYVFFFKLQVNLVLLLNMNQSMSKVN